MTRTPASASRPNGRRGKCADPNGTTPGGGIEWTERRSRAVTWWVQSVLDSQGAAALVAWIFWILLSITLHELGHGVAAI